MTVDYSSDELLDMISDEVVERLRRGERPQLADYAARYPGVLGRLEQLIPALIALEQACESPASAPRPMPQRVGEFRLIRVVGQGGMGTVYEASHESLGRTVALKMLHDHVPATMFDRFRREARAASRLQHPNVVPVYGVGECDQKPFYIMRFIPGASLGQLVARLRQGFTSGLVATPPTDAPVVAAAWNPGQALEAWIEAVGYPRLVCRWFVQIAEALAHAHKEGVLHRDIKPANILIDEGGDAWLTDFGLAKIEDGTDLTNARDVVGTLRYMAPERFLGVNDPRCDVYALGVTLYEVLTLHSAFGQLDRDSLAHAICHETPVRPRLYDPRIARDLETIVLKGMAREPDKRYATAGEFAADLTAFLGGRPISARRPGRPVRAWMWVRRNPRLAAALAGTFLAVLSVAAVLGAQNRRLNHALGVAGRQEREGERKRLDSLLAEARAAGRGGKPGRRFEAIDRVREAIELADRLGARDRYAVALRSALVVAYAVPDLAPLGPLAHYPEGSTGFDIHLAAGLYLLCGPDGEAEVRRVEGDDLVRVFPGVPGRRRGGGFSPDGRRVALLDEAPKGFTFTVHDIDGPAGPPRLSVPWAAFHAFSPVGEGVLLTKPDGTLSCYDLTTGALRASLRVGEPSKELRVAAHPRRPRAVTFDYTTMRLALCDTQAGAVLDRHFVPHPGGDRYTAAAWHPDGERLFVAGHRDSDGARFLQVFDTSRDTLAPLDDWPAPDTLTALSFHPAGHRLAGTGWSSAAYLLDVCDGRVLAQTPCNKDGATARFGAAGQTLAGYADGERLGTWRVGDGREFRVLQTSHGGQPRAPSRFYIGPANRLVAAHTGASWHCWDLDSGLCLANVERSLEFCGFNPAGELEGRDATTAYRYAVRADPRSKSRVTLDEVARTPRLAPTRRTLSADGRVGVTWDPDAEHVAVDQGDPARPTARLPTGRGTEFVTISPDGLWAVTTRHGRRTSALWDLGTGARIPALPERSDDGVPTFSPCGRWLWVNSSGGRFLRTGTWEQVGLTGTANVTPAYTADGRVMALETGTGLMRLVRAGTGELLLELDHPTNDPLHLLQFSSDGQRLLGCPQTRASGIHIWELGLLRKHMAALGLDWKN